MKRDGIAALLYLAIAVAFFFDAAIGRGALFHYDTWMQNYAFRAWWFSELKQGHFATWCPGMFAGYPLFAETQTGPLFPITFILFLLLPGPLAFSWCVILLFALAGAGSHVLVRRLGGGPAAALTGGVTFQLAGFLVTHVVHFNLLTGAALLPWSLVFAVGLLRGVNARDALGLAAVAAGFFLGSHPYAILMALLAAGVFVATFAPALRGAAAIAGPAAIAGAWALGAGLGAIQLFPAMDLLERTPRGDAVDASFLTFGSFPPRGIATLANPDVFGTPVDGSFFGDLDWSHYAETCAYVGLLPLALAVAALALRRDRATFALAALAAASFVMMLGKHTLAARVLEFVPILQSTRLPARWALPFTLAIAGLAGLGLDALVREVAARRRTFAAGAGIALVAVLVGFAGWAGREARSPDAELRTGGMWSRTIEDIERRADASWARTMIFGALAAVGAVALLTPSEKRRRAIVWAAPAIVLADLASWGASFNPRVPPAFLTTPPPAVAALPASEPRPRVFRQLVDEFWQRVPGASRTDLFTPAWKDHESTYSTGAWALPPNSQLLYGVDSGEGFTSLPPMQWLEWMGVPPIAGAAPRPDLSEAQADLLALDAVVSTGGGIAGEGWEARDVGGGVWVSRHRNPLPRVRLSSVWSVKPRAQILEAVRSADHDPRAITFLEEPLLGAMNSPGSPDTSLVPAVAASIPLDAKEIRPGSWRIHVPPASSGLVVVSESYDPGWRATGPDGAALAMGRADGLFLAITPPASGGEVRLDYRPSSLLAGAIGSGLAFVAFIALAMVAKRATSSAEAGVAPGVGTGLFAAPLVLAGLLAVEGLATDRGRWRSEQSMTTLRAAASRSWMAEAEGAYRAGAFEVAESLLRSVLRATPRDFSAQYRMGLVFQQTGRPQEAIRCFEEALALDPDHVPARESLEAMKTRFTQESPPPDASDSSESQDSTFSSPSN